MIQIRLIERIVADSLHILVCSMVRTLLLNFVSTIPHKHYGETGLPKLYFEYEAILSVAQRLEVQSFSKKIPHDGISGHHQNEYLN